MLHILWDDSHIWGLLAARAAEVMALPRRLIRAKDVAGGLLARERPSILLVPGGNARHKAHSLGRAGLDALREYVESGGRYMGFCGGAGLALSHRAGAEGIGLCPWQRGGFADRLQHFMSGHLHVALAGGESPHTPLLPDSASALRLPVWWPGRFAPKPGHSITVLASYERPAEDFWLADLPIAALPPDTFSGWQDMYGLSFTPTFLAGQPCVVYGESGKGGYLLSYSHLETPGSPEANRWLAKLFRELGGLAPERELLPPWSTQGGEARWENPDLAAIEADLRGVLRTGLEHGLLFERTDWLLGWRTGIPGANLNNLWAALRTVMDREPGDQTLACWEARRERMLAASSLFADACIQYFLAERLAQTLAKFSPDAVPPALLKDQRNALFGPPMTAGGLYRELMEPLDELAFLQLGGGEKQPRLHAAG